MHLDIRRIPLHASKLKDIEECIIYTSTRFCLKNMGDPSSIYTANATIRKTGDKITNKTITITLFMNIKTL